MAKLNGLKLSEDEVSQTIDLKELFGVSVIGSEGLKQAIGGAIIDKIVNRTESGVGVDGKKLKAPYSKDYSESLDFKAFGKSKNKVNMTLTGQMLGSLDIVESKGNSIKIGWDDSEENAKAYNHNTGDTVPKRPFFGVTEKELREIKSEFEDKAKAQERALEEEKVRVLGAILRRLQGR